MKLMKWMEGHFSRSRRKGSKEREKEPRTHEPERLSHPDVNDNTYTSCFSQQVATQLPGGCYTPQPLSRQVKKVPNIRTSFLDLAAVHDVNSPRQRSRIRTNPWLSSTRSSICSSVDSGWGSSPSSSPSESSETTETQNRTLGPCVLSSSIGRGRDVSLISTPQLSFPEVSITRDSDQLSSTTSKSSSDLRIIQGLGPPALPFSSKHGPQNPTFDVNEAFPEQLSENGEQDKNSILEVLSNPVVDGACSSTTSRTSTIHINNISESLDDKVKRLRAERCLVQEKINQIREEQQLRKEEGMMLHQELLEYRRMLLLRTLKGLRLRVEQQNERLLRAYSTTQELRIKWTET
ncbi:uncharacterized protein LOC106472526 [Limulus polyphemus]|uniref:Uncharacterized protein LOC106472526 n=1 Tax=Limulus polyphemus TaxID=6850 RepID=A0ABM1TLP9_LIMPO|nr:uncharacterized protein LOC106472526 [Limulus polyphemus]XP_022256803.1 uncharacterized protein LOC106472526 [Limulus polyphemus]XP_022256805.1 uncharacterized protein LOC106472526 [Limulus polyphemus]